MADTPNNSIPAAKPLSGPLSGLYKTSTEIAKDAVSQLKQIQAANAAQNALEGYTKGLNGLYTPVDELAKSVGNELKQMAAANPATAAAAEKVSEALGMTKDSPATNEAAGAAAPTEQSAAKATTEQTTTTQTMYSPNASYDRLTDAERQRLTGGLTLCGSRGRINAELRLNYEKYFYKKAALAKESERDKLVMEVMVHF